MVATICYLLALAGVVVTRRLLPTRQAALVKKRAGTSQARKQRCKNFGQVCSTPFDPDFDVLVAMRELGPKGRNMG